MEFQNVSSENRQSVRLFLPCQIRNTIRPKLKTHTDIQTKRTHPFPIPHHTFVLTSQLHLLLSAILFFSPNTHSIVNLNKPISYHIILQNRACHTQKQKLPPLNSNKFNLFPYYSVATCCVSFTPSHPLHSSFSTNSHHPINQSNSTLLLLLLSLLSHPNKPGHARFSASGAFPALHRHERRLRRVHVSSLVRHRPPARRQATG